MILKIDNAVIITKTLVSGASLYVKDGVIFAITHKELPFDERFDAEGLFLAPGFIDIHSHGAGGYDFADGSPEDILNAAAAHGAHGTTSIFPTLTSTSAETTLEFIENVKIAMKKNAPGRPFIPGSHLEGPYFSMAQKGAQDPRHIHPPKAEEYHAFIERGEGTVRRISYAPELEGSEELCDYLNEKGVVSAYGHTDATYGELKTIIQKGCALATHLYSGMNTVVRRNLFRELGGVETAFLEDAVTVEVIADGKHLPPELLKLIYKIKGPEKICLVSDSMRGAGFAEGHSILGPKENGQDCIIRDGIAYLPDFSAFCGSVATADRLVQVMHLQAGISLVDCIQMMCATPAKTMGLENRGKIAEGYVADLVLFDENIQIKKVWMQGKEFKYGNQNL